LIVLLLNCSVAISQAGTKYVEEADTFKLCFTTAYARVNVVHLVHIEKAELQSLILDYTLMDRIRTHACKLKISSMQHTMN
jgi:hypothetical protein